MISVFCLDHWPGTGDDLSDIDLTVVTKNSKGDTWFSSLQPTVEGISKVLLPIRTDTAKRCAVFVFDDLVEMTVTVLEESEVKPSPAYSEIKPLHDPLGLSATLKSKSSLLPKKARIEALIATESLFLWGTLAVRKRLLRDNVWDARDALEKLRYLVIRLMNLRDAKLDGYKNIEKTLDAKSIILLSKQLLAMIKTRSIGLPRADLLSEPGTRYLHNLTSSQTK